MRVVVDTNVWVSAVLTPGGPPGLVRRALHDARFSLIISEPLLEEVAEVLARPRIVSKYGVTADHILDLLGLMRERGELVDVAGAVHLCRDPDDDLVVETALNGRADTLVSRDDDLKAASDLVAILARHGVEVLTVRRFLASLDAGALP
jgi:putative PIN family toxin of toxin-antitoxin system